MLKSHSIASKMWMALSILIIGYLLSVVLGFFIGLITQSSAQKVSDVLYPASYYSQVAMTSFEKQITLYRDAVMSGDESSLEPAYETFKKVDKALLDIIKLEKLDPKKIDQVKNTRNNLGSFTNSAQNVYKEVSMAEEETEQNMKKIKVLVNETTQLKKTLKSFSKEFSEDLKSQLAHIKNITRYQQLINIIMFLSVVIVASVFITSIIKKSVSEPIQQTVVMIQDVAEGDLSKQFKTKMSGEIGQIITALNKMAQKLRNIVHVVFETTSQINSSVNEIAVAVDEQAAISSEQSSAVSEITSTMEELSTSSSEIAGHSNSVAEIAKNALDSTKEGAESVEKVMIKMAEINQDNQNNIRDIVELGKKSEEITKVMEIINTIADQTKLIAFNAALEASSAGEAGKRFGVVAVEIRRLADSVIESTSEIENKIKEIQDAINHMVIASEKSSKGIQEGLEYSTQTADKIEDIVDGAQATADAAKQISLSTQQGKTASDQVLSALKEIDKGAKQASDSINQINFVSKDLKNLSGSLANQASIFKLNPE